MLFARFEFNWYLLIFSDIVLEPFDDFVSVLLVVLILCYTFDVLFGRVGGRCGISSFNKSCRFDVVDCD